MKAVAPDAPTRAEQPVDAPRDSNGEPLHAARERSPVARFDEEVEMIVLNREMNDAKPLSACERDASANLAKENALAKGRKPAPRAERDVNRMSPRMPLARAMGDRRPPPGPPLPPRPVSRASPRVKFDLELPHDSLD